MRCRKLVIIMVIALGIFNSMGCGSARSAGTGSGNNSNDVPAGVEPGDFKNLSLKSSITGVQPMTGMVLWTDSEHNKTANIQLEYRYIGYNKIVDANGNYSWTFLENELNAVKKRKHQAVVRFYDTYPGQATTVPDYFKKMPDYKETTGKSEGEKTAFPDWSNRKYQDFIIEFFKRFAQKYDHDPRLAFLQVGFGLWAEYHIYDPGEQLGVNFPSKEFQTRFLQAMNTAFTNLYWMISIDAAEGARTPFSGNQSLLGLKFGLFDDSFLIDSHASYNAPAFRFFGVDRYQSAPMGGEICYPGGGQKNAIKAEAAFKKMAQDFHISFMIGNDQPEYDDSSLSGIKRLGMALGYKFKITAYQSSATQTLIKVKNVGIAPFYYDAFVTVDGKKATTSLKYLQPGEEKTFLINTSATAASVVAIQCDRLVEQQKIEFEANL